MCTPNKDYVSAILDEIALEGLDGITLEALWIRLSERSNFQLKPTNDKIKQHIWFIISIMSSIEFYSLPVARGKLVTFNRLEYIDASGNYYEPEVVPCIYPHCPVDKKDIMGSCSTFRERKNITEIVRKENYETVNSRGNYLVIVADQKTRSQAITSIDFNPLTELSTIQYCILERIGRSRYQGECTHGKKGLQVVTNDPKMLFYFRKSLVKNKLVVKQLFFMKVNNVTSTGSLFHLPRFFIEIKNRIDSDAIRIVEHLLKIPEQFSPIKDVKTALNLELKKVLFKYPKNFKTILVPYRSVWPLSKPGEWKMKAGEEKKVRVIKLLDPNVCRDEEEEDDDEEELGMLNEGQRRLDQCLMRQAFTMTETAGSRGIKQSFLGGSLAVPSLQARSICKQLIKTKLVRTLLLDVGRQRISHYYCKKFESAESGLSMEFQQEKTKLLQSINENVEISDENSKHDINAPGDMINNDKITNENMSVDQVVGTKETMEVHAEQDISTTTVETENNMTTTFSNINEIKAEIIIKPVVEKPMSGSIEDMMTSDKPEVKSLSSRILRRANLIVQTVNSLKVVQDFQKFQRMIFEEEELEGLKQNIDRKTIQRLVDKLEIDGLIRIIKVNLRGHGKEKNMVFICHPSVTENHSEIQSAIEQAKMKLPISCRYTEKSKKGLETKSKIPLYNYDSTAGRQYGYKPKFLRMHTLHIYLYYLIYGYDGNVNLDQSYKKELIKKFDLNDSILNEMTTVYRTELDWKIFLPPLPIHEEYPEGWCLLSDILLRLPLCLFLNIVSVPYIIPGLKEYLKHPIKKYFLVKHLPQEILHHLTLSRKYIFVTSEVITRLAYIGLVQMGPQRLKEKDQVFIYLNKNAILYNTLSSAAGYNKISKDTSYDNTTYHFVTMHDVETYWCDMWNFAMNTNLGTRNSVTGQSIVLESVNTKKELQSALQPSSIEEAKLNDVGYLPGDNLGAGGLDSDMFPHLKRNWYWTGRKNEECFDNSMFFPIRMKEITSKPVKHKRTVGVVNGKLQQLPTDKPKKTKISPNISHLKFTGVSRRSKAISKKKTRIIKQRNMKYARKPYYDQVDKDALARMNKLRVDWSPIEDKLLLLCKVASLYLEKDQKRHVVKNFIAVREILHSTYPISKNKTTKACQRRINYMMKNKSTYHTVCLYIEEVKRDREINLKFDKAIENLDEELKLKKEGPKAYQKEYDKIFTDLVFTLFNKMKTTLRNSLKDSIPDTLLEFSKKYITALPPTLPPHKYGSFEEVQKNVDILSSVINSVIHSSLCCANDKTYFAQQLFYIYQQYPDMLLRAVIAKCRSMSVISCRKRYKRWKTAQSDCLPLAASPYQLSITYTHILQTKYEYNIFSDCYNGLKTLKANCTKIPLNGDSFIFESSDKVLAKVQVDRGGECANIADLYSSGLVDLSIEFPEQLIVLDPRISETGENYKIIMKRFREMISNVKDPKKKDNKSSLSEDEECEDEDKDKPYQTDEEDESYFNLNSNNGVPNAASRLALYLKRDSSAEDLSDTVQHAHDYFVLKPCKVMAKFDESEIDNKIFFKEKKTKIISDIKRFATFNLRELQNKDIINGLKTEYNEYLITSLLNFIELKGDVGAISENILENFKNFKDMTRLLSKLVDEQYILRSGVVSIRYIHYKHAHNWLIKSFLLTRLVRENINNSSTKSYMISFAKTNRLSEDSNTDEPPTKLIKLDNINSKSIPSQGDTGVKEVSVMEIMDVPVDENTIDDTSSKIVSSSNSLQCSEDSPECDIESGKEHSRFLMKTTKRKWANVLKENVNKFDKFDLKNVKHVYVLIRPWIKVDGSLNRRVLDRMLGSVLGHCLAYPNATLLKLQNRFSPAIQPVHTFELAEILQKIGCLTMLTAKKTCKRSLFSKRCEISIEPATYLENPHEILINIEPLAVSKLGYFIGDKNYTIDYLTTL